MANEGPAEAEIKPVFWIGRSLNDLRELPRTVRQVMGYALWQAQQGRKHVHAKPLQGFGGAGVLEIVEDHQGNAFRGVYTVKYAGAVYVLHTFQKKSKKGARTAKQDVEIVRQRLQIAEEHYRTWQLSRRQQGKNNDPGQKDRKSKEE